MRPILVILALILSIAGCGAGGTTDPDQASPTSTGMTTTPAPTYRLLSKDELTKALLDLRALPAGYSPDPPTDEGPAKTFCDYPPPFQENIRVRQDFTKGAGLSAELLSVGLRQFGDADQAKASFEALTDALTTCTGETYNGVENSYAPISAPEIGEGAIGLKITAGDTNLLQFFAVVGPVLINTGGGGLMNANADEVISLLKAQVEKYDAAST